MLLRARNTQEICFAKNGTTYYAAGSTKSKKHMNHFTSPGVYRVYARADYRGTSIESDRLTITVPEPAPTVAKVDISSASISAIGDQVYTGKPVTPAPSVTLEGKALAAGTDYTVSYKNNTAVGTATLTVTG